MKEKTFFKQSVAVIIICNLILGQTIPVFAESGVTDEAIVQSEDEVESNTEEVEVIQSESETESNIGEDILIQPDEGENSDDEETVDVNLLENSTSEEVAEEDFSDSESTECLEEEFDDGEERLLSEENSEEITIYALNPNVTAISIPTDMPTSYLLPQEDGAEYKLISGEGVKVESNGRVVPITQKRYVYVITGGSGMKEEYSFGENIVSMTVGNHTQIYKVNVVDYAQYYAEQKMNAFLAENITSSMTEYEKVEKICKWLTSEFDYNANYSSDVAIMIYGGADCWGYSNAVNYLCKKCGMQAYLRYAAHDLGAGNGHQNSVVVIDGEEYMVDCSYPGSRPRHYELDKMDSPFSLRVLSDGSYSVAQYNGTNIHVTVPESFDGHKITKIDDEAFMHNIVDVESIELPDSITEIGVNAFTNCKSVKTIRIPKNVKTIERRAFAASGINDIEVDSENPFYTSVDGVVFNKNKTILVAFPAKRGGSYMIPEGVTTIEDYAFAYCEQLQTIEFPMSVRSLKEGAFGSCTSLESVVLKEGLQKIGDYAFIYDKKIDYLVIPKTVKLIGSGAFKGAVYKINVLGQDVQFGEEIISKNSTAIIAGKSESATQKYAQENGFTFIESDSDSVKLDAGWFKEITGQYLYWKNHEQTPKVELVSTAPKLDKDEDYTVTYKNNINAGEATTVIHGIGMFAGTVEKKFIINKYKMYALQDAKFKVSSYSCPDFYATGEPLTPEMVVPGCYIEGEDYEVTYKDNILPGKATVTLIAIGSYTGSCTKNFNIYGDISKQKINTVEDQVYTGKEICPKITVEGLTSGSDYKVYYYNNYAVGQATVSIAGKGYYKGVATINFNIVSPPVSEPANPGTKDNVGINSPTNEDKKNSSSVSSPLPKKETFSGILQIEKKSENNMTKKPEKVWVKQIRAHKKALKIIWKKGKNVSGYQVQYSLKRKFTSGVKNVMLTKNTASCTVKKLKTKKTYYVRVRAYRKIGKKRIYSSWSNVKKIKIR